MSTTPSHLHTPHLSGKPAPGGSLPGIDKASVSLDQWADGPAAQGDFDGTGRTQETFLHGDLNPSKAHYNEGDAIPYRAILDNLTPGVTYGVVIQWDTIDQGGYAIDYLTGYNFSFEGSKHLGEPDANPLDGVTGVSSATVTTAAIHADPMLLTGFGSQYGATDGLASGQPSGAQFVSLFGSVTGATVSATTYNADHSKASVTVTFTYTGTAANNADAVVLAWGGHIAADSDWHDDPTDSIRTASEINGAPYHMRVLSLVENGNVVSVGNQDRSMQSNVIVPPPTPSDATIVADEDSLAAGNNDTAPGDDNTSNLSGTLAVTGATDVNFASLAGGAVLDTLGSAVTSHGSALTYYWDAAGATLYASTDASSLAQAQSTAAFQIQLSGTAHLDYAFTLLQQLDHPSGQGTANDNTENPNVLIDITYTALDGTSVTGTIHLTVDDDMPVRATDATAIAATVHEDGMSTSLGDSGDLSEGNRDAGGTLADDESSSVIAGSLASLVAMGADGPGTFGFSTDTSALPHLYSHGVQVAYAVSDSDVDGVNDTLTATAGTGSDERVVFTLHVGANGAWQFDLDDQLDHVAGDGENSALITAANGSTHVDSIDFSTIVQATDYDGDTVAPLVSGDFSVAVQDDIPVRVADPAAVAAQVYEDGMSTSLGDTGDLSEGNRGGSGSLGDDETSSAIAGSLAHFVSVGADEQATFGVASDVAALPTLYSKGVAVAYAVSDSDVDGVNDTLVATAGSGETARVVFTLHVATDGSWTFDLDDQLDHVANDGENSALITSANGSTHVDSIDFSTIVQAIDNDHDAVTPLVAGDFTIAVHDDIPVRVADATPIAAEVYEDGMSTSLGDTGDLSEGNRGESGTLGDDETSSAIAGSLADLVAVGADEPAAFGLATDTSELPTLYSKGVAIAYAVSDSDVDGVNDTLVATAGSGETARVIFTLHVATDGSWTFDLDDQLDHVVDDGENSALITSANGSTEVGSIDFSTIVQAVDKDGDMVAPLVAGDFTVAVHDDVPVRLEDPTPIAASVDEGAMSTEGGDNSEGTGGEPDGDEASSTGFGALGALFGIGADEPATFGLFADTSELPSLYSKGVEVAYAVTDSDADGVNDTLTATAGSGTTERTVFTLHVATDGSWTFDLDDQLDHVAGNEENSALITSANGSTSVSSIDFSTLVHVTDNDGDRASLMAGDFTVAVQDDVPLRLEDATPIEATVREDGMSTSLGDTGDLSEGNRPVAGTLADDEASSAIAGSLASLFVVGADESPTFGLSSDTSHLPTLYSKGQAVAYAVTDTDADGVGDKLTATAGSGATERTIFTLHVATDGSWTFDLDDQLDHVTGNGENLALITAANGSTSVSSIDFSTIVQASDYDHDAVTPLLAGDFAVAVRDDVPVAFTPDSITLTNNGTATGSEDLNAAPAVGADEPGTVLWVDNYTADNLLRDSGGNVLQSNELNISLSGFGTDTLVAATNEGTVFTATIDGTTGQYSIDFDRTIDNGSGIDFLGSAPVKSGNPTFNIINNVGDTPIDLLFSGGKLTNEDPYSSSVNVSTQGAGTGNQTMNAGETLRIDFVSDAVLSGSPNGSDFSLGTSGTHQDIDGFGFLVTQNNPGGTTATLYVTAWDANDDKLFTNDTKEQVTKIEVNGQVLFDNGTATDRTINGHTVHAIAYQQGVIITGLSEGATGDGAGGDDPVIKVYDGDNFNRVEISNFAGQTVNSTVLGGANFDIAPASLGQTDYGDPVNFNLPVQMTDYDGDATGVQLVGVLLNPITQ